jgi:GNAT superfamily N-acetyltransferase
MAADFAADFKDFTIRRAAPPDAPGVLACLRAAFEPFRGQYSPAALADTTLMPATVQERLASMSVFVAVTPDGALIGTIGCHVVDPKKDGHVVSSAKDGHGVGSVKDGHIRGMAVLPRWQGRGVADQLLAAVEDELRRLGCARATLDTTAPLARAIRFYERHGYRATGRVADFYGMPLYEYAKRL